MADLIAVEVDCVRGFVRSWRGTGVVGAVEPQHVAESLRGQVGDIVYPWPSIAEEPIGERADGRFVKAFPLEFPMGQGDLRQPRLRSDFKITDALQHLLRYKTGHCLHANRGHRVVWAMFNTTLREIAYERGSLLHKNFQETVLTKAQLRELYDSRQDLVQRVAACGADVPTTSMHWKREATNLQWIVRHMSWRPPWVEADYVPHDTVRARRSYARRAGIRESAGKTFEEAVELDAGEGSVDESPGGMPDNPVASASDEDPFEVAADAGGILTERLAGDMDGGSGAFGVGGSAESDVVDPRQLWSRSATHQIPDTFGYGRIPGFWFTLNLPYNYLYEIHRFQRATNQLSKGSGRDDSVNDGDVNALDPEAREAMEARCSWVLNNPDIVATVHAIRVELLTRYVMCEIVPRERGRPFQYWLRFEFGKGGNPHAHGLCYVAGNPEFDFVVKDLATLQRLLAEGRHHPQDRDLRTWVEAERQVAEFYDSYIQERHPCKDACGAPLWHFTEPLYTLLVEGVAFPGCAKPQSVNLRALLEEVFRVDPTNPTREPDTSKLKYVLLALIESGQRHTGHGHGAPRSEDPCERLSGLVFGVGSDYLDQALVLVSSQCGGRVLAGRRRCVIGKMRLVVST